MSRRKNKRFKHGISAHENAEMRKRQRETLRRLRGDKDHLSIMITLRQLRYLDALAQYRHFGRAADACAVTQPALSMQIQDLEKQLEVDLVERRPGEVALTEIGIEVARRGERSMRPCAISSISPAVVAAFYPVG